MQSHSLPIHLRHLENIDPAFLNPDTSFVVMPEEVANDIDDVRLSLDCLAWMLEDGSNMALKLRKAGQNGELLEVPHESLAALVRVIASKLPPGPNAASLKALRLVRPDLFQAN